MAKTVYRRGDRGDWEGCRWLYSLRKATYRDQSGQSAIHEQYKTDEQDLFPLPNLAPDLAKIRDGIVNGKGFVLFRNIPVTEWGLQKSATAYMGLGTYFGYFTAQNGRGHVLGHVKDLSSKADPNDKTVIPFFCTTHE
jgi:hypothetical protein